jgi:Bacterial SH3 domain
MRRVHPVAIAIAALGALFAMSVEARAQEAGGETIGALPPETSTSAEPTDPTSSGMILVSKRPIEVLAGPSSSASILYGFPPGRPVRLIGRDGSFAKIQDVKSGAIGWIDETAVEVASSVAAAPTSQPPVGSVPSEPKAAPLNQTAERRGIFGGQGGLSGFLGGVFGTR